MIKYDYLAERLLSEFADIVSPEAISVAFHEVTIEIDAHVLKSFLQKLKIHPEFAFDVLIDLCGVDYLRYGKFDWETETATERGFSRGVERNEEEAFEFDQPRFAVVYHLLSIARNQRLRVKVFLQESHLIVPSIHDVWKSANWFEREAYDLYGILFDGHPDLRRILTDYGFIGHPFRKDFPVSGYVEMRYDATLQKVIYEPVDIVPRVLVPKVIRDDNRYIISEGVSND